MPDPRSERTYLSINTYDLQKGNSPRVFTTEHGFFDGEVGNSGAYSGSVNIRFKGLKDNYDLSLIAPDGGRLARGEYTNAQRYPFQEDGYPGMDFDGNGWGCNKLTGKFTIYEIAYWSSGEIGYLDVKFEQRCQGDTKIVYGRLRYDRRDQK